ncbi:MAG: hypothetical protein AB7R55_14450 [Gemmatimonadales bacterium]
MFKAPILGPAPLGALVLLGCASIPAEPTDPRSTDLTLDAHRRRISRMVTVPIRGSWDNTESPPVAEPPAGCTVYFETSQVGRATQLGEFTGTGHTCANLAGPPVPEPPFWDHDPAPPYLVMTFTNEMVWVAANGDELWLRPNGGDFVMSGSNGAASIRASLTVAGGTGRFEGATGSMTVRGGRGPGAPGDRLQFEGSITLKRGEPRR